MKLYYSTGTGSMSCLIAVEEAGITCELIEVSFMRNVNVDELTRLNPLGAVPTLVLDDGKVLTQNAAILEYFADLKPSSQLLASYGKWERTISMSWLSFLASDFHRSFTPVFRSEQMVEDPKAREQIIHFAQGNIKDYLSHIETTLKANHFISGSHFTAADCYLIFLLGGLEFVQISIDSYPSIARYMKEVSGRPGVARALARDN